jgi:hypothetical protein
MTAPITTAELADGAKVTNEQFFLDKQRNFVQYVENIHAHYEGHQKEAFAVDMAAWRAKTYEQLALDTAGLRVMKTTGQLEFFLSTLFNSYNISWHAQVSEEHKAKIYQYLNLFIDEM